MAKKAKGTFRPKIVAFACNWCSPDLSELLDAKGEQFPADVHFIRVMCGGRVDPGFVLKAFELGADGVFLSTCGPDECHYSFGSKKASENYDQLTKLTHLLGLEKERLRLEQLSPNESGRLTVVIGEFVEEVKKVGRSSLGKGAPTMPQEVT